MKDKHLRTAIDSVCQRLVDYNFDMEGVVMECMKSNAENIRHEWEECAVSTSCRNETEEQVKKGTNRIYWGRVLQKVECSMKQIEFVVGGVFCD